MAPRLRKFAGLVCLLVFLAAYTIAAVTLAPHVLPGSAPMAELLYYVLAGLLWTLPAAAIITWMQKRR